jgi:acetyltransferase-like isoleucine patch superfamily enzyme
MPGVLMIEALTQVASLLIFDGTSSAAAPGCAWLRGVDNAKFRRQVVPGDRLQLDVTMGRRRGNIVRANRGRVGRRPGGGGSRARHCRGRRAGCGRGHPSDRDRHPEAQIGRGTVVGPYVTIGRHVVIGRGCKIGASSVIDGWTEIGDFTDIAPLARSGSRRRI